MEPQPLSNSFAPSTSSASCVHRFLPARAPITCARQGRTVHTRPHSAHRCAEASTAQRTTRCLRAAPGPSPRFEGLGVRV
eukprot:1725232-Rhodomonas_salina.1